MNFFFFFSSRRRHTRSYGDWSSDVCSSDLEQTTGFEPVQVPDWQVSVCVQASVSLQRSEERRVGKECRSRWSRDHEKKRKFIVVRDDVDLMYDDLVSLYVAVLHVECTRFNI